MSYAAHELRPYNNTGGREGRTSLFPAHAPPKRGSRIYDPDVRLSEVRRKRAKRRAMNQRPPRGWTEKWLAAMGKKTRKESADARALPPA